jgi:hypothetical protein
LNRYTGVVRIKYPTPRPQSKGTAVKAAATTSSKPRTLLVAGLAALLAAPLLVATPGQAAADVTVRASGSVRIGTPRVRVRVRTRPHVVRPRVVRHRVVVTPRPARRLHIRGGVSVSGGIYIGRTYAEPPPPPSYDCDVPAYYNSAPPPIVVAPAVYEPMGPRFGLGVFAGGVKTDDAEGDDLGLTARYRMTRGLALEGELSRVSDAESDAETRRLGAALIWDLSSRSRLSPHLLVGMGSWDQRGYGEIGAGLTYRVSPRFHIAADLRAGAVDGEDDDTAPGTLQASSGTPSTSSDSEPENYSRGRLSAILYF